jgi:hypothetical protein
MRSNNYSASHARDRGGRATGEKLLISPPLPDAVDLQPLVARGIEANSDGYRACDPVRNRRLALGNRGRNCHCRRYIGNWRGI